MLAPPRDVPLADVFATTRTPPPSTSGIEDLIGALMASRPTWHADALCQEHPEVAFFPERGQDVRPAKQICSQCLVKAECREWSMTQGPELEGVWAGTSMKQRRQMRKVAATPRRREIAEDGRPKPIALMEKLSAYMANHAHEAHTATSLRHVSGHSPSNARALDMLADGEYVTATIGGTRNRRWYPELRLYRHVVTYVDSGAVTLVAGEAGGPSVEMPCTTAAAPPGFQAA